MTGRIDTHNYVASDDCANMGSAILSINSDGGFLIWCFTQLYTISFPLLIRSIFSSLNSSLPILLLSPYADIIYSSRHCQTTYDSILSTDPSMLNAIWMYGGGRKDGCDGWLEQIVWYA